MKKIIKYLPLIIIIVGIFFRFYRVKELFYFTMDEERDAFIFARVFKEGHIPLIGGSIPGGLYVGPIYTWISSIFLFLSKFDYSNLGFISAVIAGLSLPLLYLAVKRLFDKKVALYSLIIYSFSFLCVQFNKRYWPPAFAPSLFIFILYALSIYREKRTAAILVISLSLIVGLQSDPSNAATFLAVIIFFLFVLKAKKEVALVVGAVVFSHLPLFIFELRHNFFLVNAALKFFSPRSSSVSASPVESGLFRLIQEISLVFGRMFYIFGNRDFSVQFPPEMQTQNIKLVPLWFVITGAVMFIFSVYFLWQKKTLGSKFLTIFIGSIVIGITVYNIFFPGYIYDWFFTVALPAYAVATAVLLSKVKPIFSLSLVLIFVAINSYTNLNVNNSYGYGKKIALLSAAKKELKGQKYALIYLGKKHKYDGYRYLVSQHNFEPVKSYMDPYYEWLYKTPSSKKYPVKILAVINLREINEKAYRAKYQKLQKYKIYSATEYPIQILLIDNSTFWYSEKY
jgi:hypothetical protein